MSVGKAGKRKSEQTASSAEPLSGAVQHHPPYRAFEQRARTVKSKAQADVKLAEKPRLVSVSSQLDLKRARYIEFITIEMDLSREFAATNYDREVGPRRKAQLTQDVIDKLTSETFATRPKGEDAIAYYTRVWATLVSEGRLFIDDIEEFDYPLLRGITNRISLLAKTEGGAPSDYYPIHYPPPRRPEPPLDEVRQREREADRRASAKYLRSLRNPT